MKTNFKVDLRMFMLLSLNHDSAVKRNLHEKSHVRQVLYLAGPSQVLLQEGGFT